jgi:hypothetical protein
VAVRFLSDENLRFRIIQGVLARTYYTNPGREDLWLARDQSSGLLEMAADQDRILITYDRNRITRHIGERRAVGKPIAGVFMRVR